MNGDQATVKAVWSGTNIGPQSMPIPGMSSIPPTGKKVSVKDAYFAIVQGDKVSHLKVELPADGSTPAMLMQLGVKMPSMGPYSEGLIAHLALHQMQCKGTSPG